MNVTRDGAGLPSSLSARLRREVRDTRPEFSEAFHARLIERLAVESVSLPSQRDDGPRRRPRGLARLTVPAGAAVALAALVAVLVSGRGARETAPDSTPLVPRDRQVVNTIPAGGLESLPLYADIDAGVREGVWMLASSLVEVPDWARLADFDAPASPSDTTVP
jgi:hypothetical protein